jgi:hypothetical protein
MKIEYWHIDCKTKKMIIINNNFQPPENENYNKTHGGEQCLSQ